MVKFRCIKIFNIALVECLQSSGRVQGYWRCYPHFFKRLKGLQSARVVVKFSASLQRVTANFTFLPIVLLLFSICKYFFCIHTFCHTKICLIKCCISHFGVLDIGVRIFCLTLPPATVRAVTITGARSETPTMLSKAIYCPIVSNMYFFKNLNLKTGTVFCYNNLMSSFYKCL